MRAIRLSLAVILSIYSIPTLLSGLDIYKGTEPDLSSEWIIVCIFFVLCLLLFISNLIEFIKIDKLSSSDVKTVQ
jgi:membrane protease YdiL (CAAX protease family)